MLSLATNPNGQRISARRIVYLGHAHASAPLNRDLDLLRMFFDF